MRSICSSARARKTGSARQRGGKRAQLRAAGSSDAARGRSQPRASRKAEPPRLHHILASGGMSAAPPSPPSSAEGPGLSAVGSEAPDVWSASRLLPTPRQPSGFTERFQVASRVVCGQAFCDPGPPVCTLRRSIRPNISKTQNCKPAGLSNFTCLAKHHGTLSCEVWVYPRCIYDRQK